MIMKNTGLYSVIIYALSLILYSFDMWTYAILVMLAFTNFMLVDITNLLKKWKWTVANTQ